ncbi:MAG TPA: hypothetical protein VGK16_04075 [Candidatus Limnocylindrales bacterium]
MLDWIDPDPARALVKLVAAVAIIAMAIAVWIQLDKRTRANGGGVLAGGVVGVGVALLIVSLIPGLLPFEVGLAVLVAAFVFLYRPDVVVRMTGGPRKEWSALHEGRELAVLVRERGGPRAARSDAEIQARLAGLSKLDTPLTREYLSLVRQTLFSDPGDPALDAARAQLAAADAALRESLGVRPIWERSLERRARGEAPVE